MKKILSNEFIKKFNKLDLKTKEKIKNGIDIFPKGDIKKIKGKENLYRIRVGNYIIFFSYGVDEIHLLTISLRKDAYKNKN